MLERLYRIRTTQLPVNSVRSPSAQTSTLCTSRLNKYEALDVHARNFLLRANEPLSLKAIIALMYQEGLRVSEVLSINPGSITSDLHIIIRGKKGSGTRIITPVFFREFWERYRCSTWNIAAEYNRFYVYRLCKKYGLYITNSSGKRSFVTHSFRHNIISSLINKVKDTADVQHYIGHKSHKSTIWYDENEKGKK